MAVPARIGLRISCKFSAASIGPGCDMSWRLVGEFDERVLCGMDWVVAEARKRRLLLLPCLLNYWDAYGGGLPTTSTCGCQLLCCSQQC